MNIQLVKYILDENGNNGNVLMMQLEGDTKKWYVPTDPANADYQAIQKWVAEGNTIAEAD